ncbi:hypothetical protein COT95_02005 [Candidatus Falkowbacteria bacterium CG10_big_fil_rev_8_21_14_0_10_37_6]|uniref:Uncharacterized protein n=1 Tax=Candidatus Falkowbacteria bacterium CG10_big_fil_rev_8_21_14_0_10_37_6 TaxID=1974563 RepID=A0A2H0V937_9BACT|nr:MAG: hypothetical protein COT95_02005 [Candidatus Falkowbacteria bacterium CG10_big_fil_rev_8_21_14_0_10_37_6]
MPSPNLKTKINQSSTIELSETAKDLFRVIYQSQKSIKESKEEEEQVAKIRVNEIISKMSFFYEKIRNAVDYKEDHLLRKNAIERILRRLSLTGHHNDNEIAKTLLVELIRGGYLANNSVPETKIKDLEKIIERFSKLKQLFLAGGKKTRQEVDDIKKWIFNLAATEIEENFGDHRIDQVIGQHMFEIINANIVDLGKDAEFIRDKKIQIYIAIFSKLFKYDDAMLEFLLFRYINPNWPKASDEDIALIAQHHHELVEFIAQQLAHPFRKQIGKVAFRYTIYFSMLRDAVEENPQGAYDKLKNNPNSFKKLIEKVCESRYKESRGKLRRGAVRSIIYLFLTKTLLVFILEAPVIVFLGDELVYYSLIINIMFPPTLLLMIALFTGVPGKQNTARIQEGIEEILVNPEFNDNTVKLKYPTARTSAVNIIFRFFYAVMFLASFGLVIWGLVAINFNIISIVIFILFLSFVSFFGIRLARFARAYAVVENRENIFSFFANFFYVPIIGLGKWMSETFSQINLFIFILDFIIEAPFKIFVEIFEQWSTYIKERKEEVVD